MGKKHGSGLLFFKLRDDSPKSPPPRLSPPSAHSSSLARHACEDPNSCVDCPWLEEFDGGETEVRHMRSDRLFFDLGGDTSSIMEEAKPTATQEQEQEEQKEEESPFEDSVAVAVESEDPYGDFRRSMDEMVAAQGLGASDWERLEELLCWYLRVNGRKTHGFIVGAFLDMLAAIAASSSSSSSSSASSSSSSSSSSASNSFKVEELTEEETTQ